MALCTGITAAVYKGILAYEKILNWWFMFGSRFDQKWWHAPVWGCIYCISGQFGMWAFLLSILPFFLYQVPGILIIFGLILTISASILIATTVNRFIQVLQNDEKWN